MTLKHKNHLSKLLETDKHMTKNEAPGIAYICFQKTFQQFLSKFL